MLTKTLVLVNFECFEMFREEGTQLRDLLAATMMENIFANRNVFIFITNLRNSIREFSSDRKRVIYVEFANFSL